MGFWFEELRDETVELAKVFFPETWKCETHQLIAPSIVEKCCVRAFLRPNLGTEEQRHHLRSLAAQMKIQHRN